MPTSTDETALARVEHVASAMAAPEPKAVIQQATKEANVLAGVIDDRGLFVTIQGRKYVRVEGWTTLAIMRGCLSREVSTEAQEDGRYIAVVELVRLTDGAVLTRASAECGGPDEPTWQNRPPYARRSMAQTRAAGKACRLAFSWVMALTGYETTPAEEMDGVRPSNGSKSQSKEQPSARSGNTNSAGRGRAATKKQLDFMRRLQDDDRLPEGYRDRLAQLLSDPELLKDDASKALDICTKKLDEIKQQEGQGEPEPPPAESDDAPPWMYDNPEDIPV